MQGRTLTILFAIAASTACGGSSTTSPVTPTGTNTPTGTSPGAATTSVAMSGFQFAPAAITVSPGSVVTWTNLDNTNHNVTFSASTITSIGNFASGAHTATMPQAAGTYSYRCTIHPTMTGTVTVQ